MGLREDKKARTRQMISDLATCLFMERGYNAVTTAEIAEKAEVSVATLFNYFPVKEALVFDEDEAMEAALVDAVLSRPAGQSILEALRVFVLEGPFARAFRPRPDPAYARFMAMVQAAPDLVAYMRQMSARYEKALAAAIHLGSDGQASEAEAATTAHFVLDAVHFAQNSALPAATFNTAIDLLVAGAGAWDVSWTTRYPAA